MAKFVGLVEEAVPDWEAAAGAVSTPGGGGGAQAERAE